jgi:competence protein ComEA
VQSWRERLDAVAAALGVAPIRLLGAGAVVVAVLVVGGVIAAGHSLSGAARPPTEDNLPRATPPTGVAATDDGGPMVVAAAGAVARPGVYKLAAGSRVTDVLEAAGGPTADADVDRINLAAKVADGERVYVPRKGEAAPPVASSGDAHAKAEVVDLNTATAEELEALPGVGPATAQAILDYRAQHRRFRSVDELLEVRGIGEAKLAQLRPHVRVS